MYAIIEVGGKQYSVKKDDIIEVEKQAGADGKDINISSVLMVVDKSKLEIGQPHIKGAKVVATVLCQTKGEKLISYKYRRRKGKKWTKGHRQQLTRLKIKEIVLS